MGKIVRGKESTEKTSKPNPWKVKYEVLKKEFDKFEELFNNAELSFILKSLITRKSAYNINIERARKKGKESGNIADLIIIEELIKRIKKKCNIN